MKAILIDAKNRIVSNIEISEDIKDIQDALNCRIFTTGMYLKNKDVMFVDDEGLLNGTHDFFTYKGAHQPFAGNGLIMGSGPEGETVDCKVSLIEVAQNVNFYGIEELALIMEEF
jgi:hypothetical protein